MKNETINFDFVSEVVVENFAKTYNKVKQPVYIGCYRLGGNNGLSVYLYKKPNFLHRKLMQLFLGWKWIDNK